MYKIKDQYLNQIFKMKKSNIDISFDTSQHYTQYQLHNMYKLEIYSKYIEFIDNMFTQPSEEPNTIELEYVQLPKQTPLEVTETTEKTIVEQPKKKRKPRTKK